MAFKGRIEKTETGCRPSQWFGEWAVLPEALHSWIALVQASDLAAVSAMSAGLPSSPLYSLSADGIAVIGISGPMAKYGSSVQSVVGGTSTLEKRQALRAATRDPNVKASVMLIDSPGGTVAGCGDLADAVAQADKVKPVYAYIEDMGGSAAYRVASRARKIYANADAQVGSIGTYAVLEDSSGAYAKDGVKVHVVNSGGIKGMGVPGTEITDAQLAETQRRVDALNEQFLADVSMGRKLPMSRVRELADGRVHMAQAAKDMGLIDSVASLDQAMREIGRQVMDEQAIQMAEARAEAAEKQLAEFAAKVVAAEAKLAEIAAKEALAEMQANLDALKNINAQTGLAEALVKVKAALPAEFAVIETQIRAWDGQVTVAALFNEQGSARVGEQKQPVDVNDATAFRAAADERVKEGKAKDSAEAMTQILKEKK